MSRDCEIVLSMQTSLGTILMGFMPREPARARPNGEPFNYPQITYQLPPDAVTISPQLPVNVNERVAS